MEIWGSKEREKNRKIAREIFKVGVGGKREDARVYGTGRATEGEN